MKNKMRKIRVLFSVLVSLTALCGCSVVRDRIGSVIWERSGIAEDASYLEYKNLEMNEHLDDEGLYRSEELERQRDQLTDTIEAEKIVLKKMPKLAGL